MTPEEIQGIVITVTVAVGVVNGYIQAMAHRKYEIEPVVVEPSVQAEIDQTPEWWESEFDRLDKGPEVR